MHDILHSRIATIYVCHSESCWFSSEQPVVGIGTYNHVNSLTAQTMHFFFYIGMRKGSAWSSEQYGSVMHFKGFKFVQQVLNNDCYRLC